MSDPFERKVSEREYLAAVFLIGINAGFNARGYPSSLPRRVFNGCMTVAREIAGSVGKVTKLRQGDYRQVSSMVSMAESLGFDQVRIKPRTRKEESEK